MYYFLIILCMLFKILSQAMGLVVSVLISRIWGLGFLSLSWLTLNSKLLWHKPPKKKLLSKLSVNFFLCIFYTFFSLFCIEVIGFKSHLSWHFSLAAKIHFMLPYTSKHLIDTWKYHFFFNCVFLCIKIIIWQYFLFYLQYFVTFHLMEFQKWFFLGQGKSEICGFCLFMKILL